MIPPLASSAPTTGAGDPAAAAVVGFWLTSSSMIGEDAGLFSAVAASTTSFDLDSASLALPASFSSILKATEDGVSVVIILSAPAPFHPLALIEASGEVLLLIGLDDMMFVYLLLVDVVIFLIICQRSWKHSRLPREAAFV